jgi:light-regulated signal transduction histidine kinase (bacteriophytochrome)
MSAAAVLIESPTYLEANSMPERDEVVRDFIHDMRQPLSSIEAIAYYLEMTLPAEQLQARQYMRRLQQLVYEANTILHDAAVDARVCR